MLRNKIFAFLFVVFCVSSNLYAAVHSISHNVATIIELQDGDEIELTDFPVGWGYSRIVLGVNSVPALQLSGRLVANDCNHELHNYYEEFDISYTSEVKIVYHGPTQRLPIQWWVDASPVLSSCKSYSDLLRTDSIMTMLYNFADSIYSEKIKNYRDLGELNSETLFEGTSSKFKITDLPSWFYNVVYVQVESMDGRELNGAAYVGKGRVEIKGYSEKFTIEQKTLLSPTFELAFPEYRKVKLKWWAEVQAHSEFKIESKETQITSDSVEVEYTFGDNLYSKSSVKLAFNKRKFVDGKVPVVKKLSFNPQGPNKSKDFGVRGNIYDFDAKIKLGDSVVIAIPLDFEYQSGRDSVTIEHFISEENKWIEHPVDSIVDNFAYIKVGHFSWLRAFCRVFVSAVVYAVPGTAVCAIVSESCHDAISGFIDDSANLIADGIVGVANGVKWVYEVIKGLVCGDLEKLKKLFGVSSSKSDWELGQGTIENLSIMQKGYDFIKNLNDKRNVTLVKLSDPYVEDECKMVNECRNNPIWPSIPCDQCGNNVIWPSIPIISNDCKKIEEICNWNRTKNNLDVILADAILSQFNPENVNTSLGLGVSKYKFYFDRVSGKGKFWDVAAPDISYDYDDYFMTSSELTEEAAWFVEGVKSCIGAVNFTGMMVQRCVDWWDGMTSLSWPKTCNAIFGFVDDRFEWFSDLLNCPNFLVNYKDILNGHENKLIAASESMARVSLLAWLKKADDFRNFTLLKYKAAYDGILAWVELAGALMDYNNISIKAYASLALYEYIHFGIDENLKMLNGALNRHYGDNGGYSEGTGYSQYIWDDVPYVLAALKDAYKQKNETFEINEKFLKSPDYMFEFSRPVGGVGGDGKYKHYGLIPVEVDDGVTYNPDYRVWAKLKDDPKYLAMSEKYPLKESDGKINPLVAFGFPDMNIYVKNDYIDNEWKSLPYHGTLWGDFKDGIGLITAVNGDDTVALSMIAENGKMWTRGQAHDQQDNLSITLTSSKKGFLIQDPGYSGFGARSPTDMFHRYNDHNVLVTEYAGVPLLGQDDNRKIPFGDLWSRTYDLTGDFPGFGLSTLLGGFELFSSFDKNYSVEGGEPATVLDKKINEPQNGVIGFTASTSINKLSKNDKYDNYRTIMYFGGNFWVIDRPRTDDLVMWLANSPKKEWDELEKAGLNLYGSWDGKLTPEGQNINVLQNGLRTDFIFDMDQGGWVVQNHKYTAFDKHTKTYVMTYSLGDETFAMDRTYCPITAYQCFVNTSKNMRVIVPPAGESFKLCDVLPKNECSGEARSTGITMLAKTPLGEWTTRWVLDGDLWAGKKGLDFKIASATVSRTSYIYEKLDGTSVTGMHTGTYLPALPILLLR